jgi:hypothetical protein
MTDFGKDRQSHSNKGLIISGSYWIIASGAFHTDCGYNSADQVSWMKYMTAWDKITLPDTPVDSEDYTCTVGTGTLYTKKVPANTYNAQTQGTCVGGSRTIAHAVSSSASPSTSYTYDCNGNMTGRTVGGVSYTLSYDAENRMTGVSGGATASFVYDGDGDRVKATVNGSIVVYIGAYFEWSGSASTMISYYSAGGVPSNEGRRVAIRTGTTLQWLIGDHLGSTTVATDSSGVSTGTITYKPWGETESSWGTIPTKRLSTGQLDGDAGVVLFQCSLG